MAAWDVIIVGSGVGGGAIALSLAGTGRKVLLLERGDWLPQEPQNWDVAEVFDHAVYKTKETWDEAGGAAFKPGVHYWVGGNTRLYGASMPRLRERDFGALEHIDGTSPAWPVSYADMAPWYDRAEELFHVHGLRGEDPTDPPAGPFPFAPVEHEPVIEQLSESLKAQGLHPAHLPLAVDLQEGGKCIRCKTCDGFPCKVRAKWDAEEALVRPALAKGGIELRTRTLVKRIVTEPGGRRVRGVEVETDGVTEVLDAGLVVLSAGTVNSAALLLRSATPDHPSGLANGSDQVGRNYMVHNNAALMAVHPTRINPVVFQKSMVVNDFYFEGPDFKYPLGNLQMLGKLQGGMLAAAKPLIPKQVLSAMARRSIDWWVMGEDLPDPDNRVTLGASGRITVRWKARNTAAHRRLIHEAQRMMRRAGYPVTVVEKMGIATNSHQVGTVRFGADPATSALDPFCRAHEVENLYVVDGSFFPSSAAVNPALTITAQALRVGEHLLARG
ncbi:MAG: GMC family oxidoreductase [Chloroflexota bacterium]